MLHLTKVAAISSARVAALVEYNTPCCVGALQQFHLQVGLVIFSCIADPKMGFIRHRVYESDL